MTETNTNQRKSKFGPGWLLAAVLLGTLGFGASTGAAEQPLADFRRVVVADDALPVTKYAAEELANYAGKVAGTKLEIVPLSKDSPSAPGKSFFVGEGAAKAVLKSELAPWKNEEYLLKSVDRGLVLAGQDKEGDATNYRVAAGSQLAVYTLLDDHLGVKWFWPGFAGEHVPNNPKAVVPALDVRQAPAFVIRSYQIGYPSYHNPTFGAAARQWLRRSRQAWTMSAVFGHSWGSLVASAGPAGGGKKEGQAGQAQNSPPAPEWLALVNGKRQGPQVCTTHPHVIEATVKRVLESKLDITHISPNDGGGFCQCNEQTKSETHKRLNIPSCTSLDVPGVMISEKQPQLSDRIFTYANEVARRVREKNPEKAVGMFAYTYYNKPPVKLDHIEPNLYLSFVNQAMSHVDPDGQKYWKETISGWQKFGVKMVMREGWGNHYLLDLPFIHAKQVLEAIPYAHSQGFIAVYGEGSKAFATQAPTSWAVARMMWDPTQDAAKVMEDFYQSAYGPVAQEMRAYWQTYENAVQQNWPKRRQVIPSSGFPYANIINSWHIVFPASVVKEAEKHLKAAEAKVASAPGEYKDRIAFHRFGQDYTRTLLELLDCYRQLANLGFKVAAFKAEDDQPQKNPAREKELLQRAYELGEQREQMLLAHRDWAAIDEGLYSITVDLGNRPWHANVKKALGINKPSPLAKASLNPPKAAAKAKDEEK